MKKLLSTLTAAALFGCCMLSGMTGAIPAAAADHSWMCESFSGSNINAQNYSFNTAVTVGSALVRTDTGWLRIQNGVAGHSGEVMAESYDAEFRLKGRQFIKQELPVFGGFYAASDGSYYIITGQTNPEYDDTVPVINIAKYDAALKKLNSAEILGGNTKNPFDGGSLRCDDNGKELVIRTCHVMYPAADGRNHQANVNIRVNLETTEIIEANYLVSFSQLGYVSHSFNQFIKLDGDQFAAVDHGDAYPRSVVLRVGTLNGSDAQDIDVFTYGNDQRGNNKTGVTVGGLEKSSTHYLIAGSSINQQDFDNSETHNVFVSAVPADAPESCTVRYLTEIPEGESSASNPQLAPNGDGTYTVLWSRGSKVYYTVINSDGTQKDKTVYSADGALSDCVPVPDQGKLVWYTWKDDTVTFYRLDPAAHSVKSLPQRAGHTEKAADTADENGKVTLECTRCGEKRIVTVPTKFNVAWNTVYGNEFPEYFTNEIPVVDTGALVSVWCMPLTECDIQQFVFELDGADCLEPLESDDPELTQFRVLDHDDADSTVSMKIYPQYNPKAAKTFELKIAHDYQTVKDASGAERRVCSICGKDAEKPEFTCDLNADGTTGIDDAVMLMRFLAETPGTKPDAAALEKADLNGDSLLTLLDARLLLRLLLLHNP